MAITREMILRAQAASALARKVEGPVLAANRRYWKQFFAAREQKRKDLKRQIEALLK